MALSHPFKKSCKTEEEREPEDKDFQPINDVSQLELNRDEQADLLAAHAEDPELTEIVSNPKTPFPWDGPFLMRYDHVCIPSGRFCQAILHDYHHTLSKGHKGVRKEKKDLVTRISWKTMRQDIKRLCAEL